MNGHKSVRILGIGSPFGDDQAGWLTVDALLAHGGMSGEYRAEKLDRPGATLIAHMENTDRVILVDAMQSGEQAGTIRQFEQQDWATYSGGLSSHSFGVIEALNLACELDHLPSRLTLYGIAINEARPGGDPSIAVQAAALKLAAMIATELAPSLVSGSEALCMPRKTD